MIHNGAIYHPDCLRSSSVTLNNALRQVDSTGKTHNVDAAVIEFQNKSEILWERRLAAFGLSTPVSISIHPVYSQALRVLCREESCLKERSLVRSPSCSRRPHTV